MLITAKKPYKFVRNENGNAVQTLEIRPQILTKVPGWIKNIDLFNEAVSGGDITIVEKPPFSDKPKPASKPIAPPKAQVEVGYFDFSRVQESNPSKSEAAPPRSERSGKQPKDEPKT